MQSLRLLFRVVVIATAFGIGARPAHAQADVIRGTILGPDKKPVENATVTVSYYDGSLSREARTDKNGRFAVTFADGTGDYWVNVAALGFLAKRYEIKRLGDEDILIADASLSKTPNTLDAVHVTASRQKPPRTDTSDIGGTTHTVSTDMLTLDQLGDLSAMAATLPGVIYIPGTDGGPSTFSVLGLDASQNQTLLDGSQSLASNLPRDAQTSVSVAVSQYDVSRGGASGGTLIIRTAGGNNFEYRHTSTSGNAPQLEWTTASSTALGLRTTYADFGGAASGPIKFNKVFYAGSYQFSQTLNPVQTPLNTSPLGLEAAGIAADSVTRLVGLLQQNGIPATVGGLPTNRAIKDARFLGRFDFTPPSPTSGQQFALTVNGEGSMTEPVSLATTTVPSYGGSRDRFNGTVVGRSTDYFGCCVLSETTIGATASRVYSSPYLNLPAGAVLVSSTFADGTPGTSAYLRFGGNQGLNTASTTSLASYYNMLSWFSANNQHRIKFTTELTEDAYWANSTTNGLGTFTYNSLEDVEEGTPTSFTRSLAPRILSLNQVRGGASLGDAWRPNQDFQLQYGVRLDGNHFNSPPAFDPAVEQQFGLSTNKVPDRLYASPRVGFSWAYGSAQQVAGVVGAARTPRAVVRGGIGVFQNVGPSSQISSPVTTTGLPGSMQQLDCVGTAVPTPDWTAYAANAAAIPTQCADGTLGTVFANSAPGVVVFDPNYVQPRSVRGNLQWNGALVRNFFNTTVDYTQSLNINQIETANINFGPTKQFTLANEDNRPVYVTPASIVPATGAIAPGAASVNSDFSTVTEIRSDAMSETKQVTVTLSPVAYGSVYSWRLSYVHQNVQSYNNGFSSNTDGDPFEMGWARSPNDYHHQITWAVQYYAANTAHLTLQGRFQSGGAYTPIVGGDINGDGTSGDDRAFVFNPANTTDPNVASGMQALLATGSSGARSCLSSQLGQIAARSSCVSPWSEQAGLTVTFNSLQLRIPQRATISFSINNIPSALDLALHDEDHLHGWGQPPSVDQTLLYVRGFNPSTDEYIYQVNPRFGSTLSTPLQPSLFTLLVNLDIAPSRERQSLTQMLDRGRKEPGVKASATSIKAIYGGGGVTNPMAMILRQSDSLKLTTDQADSIAAYNRYFTTRLDSLWTPIAEKLAALPNKYNQDDAYDIYHYGRMQSFDLLIAIGPRISDLLTGPQKRMLPPNLAPLLDPKYLEQIRSSTSTGGAMNAIIR